VPTEVTGKDLFGNRTWGKSWKDGYEPLGTLDVDGNGSIEANELKNLYIWLDGNTNAKVETGEVKEASSYLLSIFVKPIRDEEGNAWADEGAKLLDGRIVKSWDWWSKAYRLPVALANSAGDVVPVPFIYESGKEEPSVLYSWKMEDVKNDRQVNGYLRFFMENGQLYVMTLPEKEDSLFAAVIGRVEISSNKKEISWKFGQGSVVSKVVISDAGVLNGETSDDEISYRWVAEPVSKMATPSPGLRALANFDLKGVVGAIPLGFAYLEPSYRAVQPLGEITQLINAN
jgi:hypothetical protein